jgi:hypothetical protein
MRRTSNHAGMAPIILLLLDRGLPPTEAEQRQVADVPA